MVRGLCSGNVWASHQSLALANTPLLIQPEAKNTGPAADANLDQRITPGLAQPAKASKLERGA